MWAVVVVMLGFLSGPSAIPVTDAGTFSNEAACTASIKKAVPLSLDATARGEFDRGERRYICVRVKEAKRS